MAVWLRVDEVDAELELLDEPQPVVPAASASSPEEQHAETRRPRRLAMRLANLNTDTYLSMAAAFSSRRALDTTVWPLHDRGSDANAGCRRNPWERRERHQ